MGIKARVYLQVITLGGLAALQNSCGSDNIVNNPAVASNLAAGGGCGKQYFRDLVFQVILRHPGICLGLQSYVRCGQRPSAVF
jgi:hypothetical protein